MGAAVLLALVAAMACGRPSNEPQDATREVRERAYRANNVGVALLEQLNYADAAAAFRGALAIDGTLAIARLNLALALMYDQDLDGAAREATEAARLMPDAPQPPYVLGLVARAQSRNDEARTFFERVRQLDPDDVGANVNLAQIHLEAQRYSDASALLRPTVAREPYHVTAAYVLGLALSRGGAQEEGQRLLERAQSLRRVAYAVTFGTGYLEQGRYAEAVASSGAEPDLVDSAVPAAAFTPAPIASGAGTPQAPAQSPIGRSVQPSELTEAGGRELAAALGGGSTPVDVDGDGDLDLVVVSRAGQRLLRQDDGGVWTDATAGSGLETAPPGSVGIGVVSADYDNDGAADLFVLRYGTSSLYRNDGKGHFSDTTRAAGIAPYRALPSAVAFVDVDHDGDVDLLIAGLADLEATRREGSRERTFPADFAPAPLQLLRNNQNGTFTNVTRESGLERGGHAVAIAPTDYDNHRDVDLLVVYSDAPPALFANQRDGTFRDVAADSGLGSIGTGAAASVRAVAVGDADKDDAPDFFFADSSGGTLALSDGRGGFATTRLAASDEPVTAAQFVDYDMDGLLDLVLWSANGPRLQRNLGSTWSDVSARAVAATSAQAAMPVRGFAIADMDRDGDADMVASDGDGAVWLWRNSGDARNRSLRIELRGRVTNRSAVGSKVQVRAGSLSARLETSAASPAVAPADVVVGLGPRPGAEAARVLWPSGILQAETAAPAADGQAPAVLPSPFRMEELDRKPSSCPFLFAWNGERFEFITDFLGGGEMGYWEAPGVHNHPDPVEYVRIAPSQLRPRGDRLDLRVTNELEEVLYLDRMQLLAVDHPADVQVYPNEGMTTPAKEERIHAVSRPRPPVLATDDHGHDVTDRIAAIDRRYPDDFARARIRGYAGTHTLTLDLGAGAEGGYALLLTGWTDYAFSSDNVAAHQAGLALVEPLLEVRSRAGQWRKTPLRIGIPVGRPQTIPLDLTGTLRPGEHEVRLTTNMRIYWDQIQVATPVAADGVRTLAMDPLVGTLRERGFSEEVRPDEKDPPVYDYARATPTSPWKTFAGRYTRVGDVLSLLTRTDDQFVIAKPGDEVALEFPASAAGAVPAGWVRTYFLRGDGYSKEMDVNSASPDAVEPLPFHAMSSYPYGSSERYPDSPEHNRYREEFNTRYVGRNVPTLRTSD